MSTDDRCSVFGVRRMLQAGFRFCKKKNKKRNFVMELQLCAEKKFVLDHQVPLKEGLNLLHWSNLGVSSERGSAQIKKPVLISKVEISGVAFTSQCTKCRPGTYSEEGADHCDECPANTFSEKAAAGCSSCDLDTYSGKSFLKSTLARYSSRTVSSPPPPACGVQPFVIA